jgi:transcriptional regulator GlxA family with amidase domain
MCDKLLSNIQALLFIRDCRNSNIKILGIDGFISTPKGNIASLDLIIDISAKEIGVLLAAERAEKFVSENAREDIFFEFCIE